MNNDIKKRRILGYFIDIALTYVLILVFPILLGIFNEYINSVVNVPYLKEIIGFTGLTIMVLIGFFLDPYLLYKYKTTISKYLVGLRIKNFIQKNENDNPTFIMLFLRQVTKVLSLFVGIFWLVNVIVCFADKDNRTIHDMASNTMYVKYGKANLWLSLLTIFLSYSSLIATFYLLYMIYGD